MRGRELSGEIFPLFSNTTGMAPGIYDLILTQMELDLQYPAGMRIRREDSSALIDLD
jgi:hypothetical protein